MFWSDIFKCESLLSVCQSAFPSGCRDAYLLCLVRLSLRVTDFVIRYMKERSQDTLEGPDPLVSSSFTSRKLSTRCVAQFFTRSRHKQGKKVEAQRGAERGRNNNWQPPNQRGRERPEMKETPRPSDVQHRFLSQINMRSETCVFSFFAARQCAVGVVMSRACPRPPHNLGWPRKQTPPRHWRYHDPFTASWSATQVHVSIPCVASTPGSCPGA